jgi:hypothetical protein
MIFNARGIVRRAIVLAAFAGTMATIPAWWSGRDAAAWYAGDLERHRGLARTVARQISDGIDARDYKTGSSLFSGEWLFGTYLMAGIGFCQLVLEHPETAEEFIPQIEHCITELASKRVREFDTNSWDNDALETLDSGRGHAAYLGYFNLLLGLYREIDPKNRFAELNDRITVALEKRMTSAPNGLIETYPGEWYPVDNTPALASIAMNDHVMDRGPDKLLDALVENFRRHAIDPQTGLLIQALAADGTPVDSARGSGSALGAFFLGHGLQPLASEIFSAVRRELAVNVLGFGAIREYPRGESGGGDIDSGPIVFGLGFSATGFSIGGARMCHERVLFHRLWASACLAGAPVNAHHDTRFITAGPLGNAILLAMLTARPEGEP